MFHLAADHDGSLGNAEVRDVLTGMDVSESSPVDANGRDLGTEVGDDTLHLRGDSGDWTKKSTEAVTDAVKNLDAVDAKSVEVEGGYDG